MCLRFTPRGAVKKQDDKINMNEFQNNTQADEQTKDNSQQEEQSIPEMTISSENVSANTEGAVAQTEKKSVGQIIGIVLIIAVIIIGGLYFYGKSLYNSSSSAIDDSITAEDILSQPDESTQQLLQQGTSDEIVDIEQDLNMTDLENLDAELGNIDAELGI